MNETALLQSGHWLGASCLAAYRDEGFVLAARTEGDALVVSGIGGKVESGETFREAAMREFLEETGVAVRLVPFGPAQILGDSCADLKPVPDAAAFIISRPPQHPNGGLLIIAMYLGLIERSPRPVEKIEYFPLFTPERWREAPGQLTLGSVRLLQGDLKVSAQDVLPSHVHHVEARDTARAVLQQPALLEKWWHVVQESST